MTPAPARAADEGVTRIVHGRSPGATRRGSRVRHRPRHGARRRRVSDSRCAARSACSPTTRRAVSRTPGSTAYNHNLDTSPEFYGRIITTRVYDERLRTLAAVSQRRDHRVLRRDHRHGRVGRATGCGLAAAARAAASASGERADQSAAARGRARRSPASRPLESAGARRGMLATARILMPRRHGPPRRRAAISCRAKRRCSASWPAPNSIFVGDTPAHHVQSGARPRRLAAQRSGRRRRWRAGGAAYQSSGFRDEEATKAHKARKQSRSRQATL